MTFDVYELLPSSERKIGRCVVNLSTKGEFDVFEEGTNAHHRLERAVVVEMAAHGMFVQGMAEVGCDRKGRRTFRLERWWCREVTTCAT